MTRKFIATLCAVFLSGALCAQNPAYKPEKNAHSHNDYARFIPFYTAYSSHFASIEADIFLVNGELFVAHDAPDITAERTLYNLYIEPIVRLMEINKGTVYPDGSGLQLLIDLKSDYKESLPALEKLLLKYKKCFDTKNNPGAVKVVLSGGTPEPSLFSKYNEILWFDGRPYVDYTPEQAKRLAMISDSFGSYATWDGKGDLSVDEVKKMRDVVDETHDKGVPFRFWGCPDTEKAWNVFMELGLDYINTDRPAELAIYMNNRR